ncbi:MAG: hypothetical protein JSV99_01445 [Planctomycetota bacterium]|nr:MAG: hypothetical protein JSV99_01445 [Planctomycetota bacterium]
MSKAKNNEQIDADIQQAKKDVLRARDIIPGGTKRDKPDSAPLPAAEQKQTDMPRFDLAEEIMANQRKITAIKRKAPGKKTTVKKVRPQAERLGYTIEPPTPASTEQDRIIAEIVAKDIERLCGGQFR